MVVLPVKLTENGLTGFDGFGASVGHTQNMGEQRLQSFTDISDS